MMNIVIFSSVDKVANKEFTRLVKTYPSSLSLTSTIFSWFICFSMLMKFIALHKELQAIKNKYTERICTSWNWIKKKIKTIRSCKEVTNEYFLKINLVAAYSARKSKKTLNESQRSSIWRSSSLGIFRILSSLYKPIDIITLSKKMFIP